MLRPEKRVPPAEVQPIVAAKVPVMEVVVRGRRVQAGPALTDEAAGEGLDPQVAEDIADDHVEQEQEQGDGVSRDQEDQKREDPRLHQGLHG